MLPRPLLGHARGEGAYTGERRAQVEPDDEVELLARVVEHALAHVPSGAEHEHVDDAQVGGGTHHGGLVEDVQPVCGQLASARRRAEVDRLLRRAEVLVGHDDPWRRWRRAPTRPPRPIPLPPPTTTAVRPSRRNSRL